MNMDSHNVGLYCSKDYHSLVTLNYCSHHYVDDACLTHTASECDDLSNWVCSQMVKKQWLYVANHTNMCFTTMAA